MTTPAVNAFSAVNEPLDPSKHVHYLLGMVLGVKDFTQEFTYLSNRDQWLARDTLGYGTLCGLRLSFDKDKKELTVEPGVALNPHGQFIQVDISQCAKLDTWFAQTEIQDIVKAANGDIKKIQLTLCYRPCLSDPVQIAGEPCRTDTGEDNSLLKPSRVQDDFQLNLLLKAANPDQTEEDALRMFVAWLRQLKVEPSGPMTPGQFAEKLSSEIDKALEAAKDEEGQKKSPLAILEKILDEVGTDIVFAKDKVSDFLREAFRLWVTALRPWLRGQDASCVDPSQENCVLLADLDITLSGNAAIGWKINTLAINEERRPYLLHLRMIQEWMLRKTAFPGNTVVEEKGWNQSSAIGSSELYSRADHTHGTPKLDGDVVPENANTTNNKIARLQKNTVNAPNPTNNQVLTFVKPGAAAGEWQAKNLPDLNGEVTGPINDTHVAKIIGVPVSDQLLNPPAHAGQVLTLTGADPKWQAMDLPQLNGDVTGTLNNNEIKKLQKKDVAAANPQENQVLTFKNNKWQAVALPPAAPAPLPNGDVINLSSGNTISKLQGKPVDAPSPAAGNVLTFIQGSWVPKPPTNVTGKFVDRSLEAPYSIVAAGSCSFEVAIAESGFLQFSQEPTFRSSYNKLAFIKSTPDAACFSFNDYVVPNLNGQNGPIFDYIIKLTPGWGQKGNPFETYFIEFKDDCFIIGFSVHATYTPGTLMIEVSRFEPEPSIGPASRRG
jgi:hypothetical protein